MASVYSQRLVGYRNFNTAQFTVPAGFVWVVRQITSFAGGPVAGGYGQWIDHASGATIWYEEYSPNVGADWNNASDMRLVLEPGQVVDLLYNAGLGAGVDLAAYGYSLSNP